MDRSLDDFAAPEITYDRQVLPLNLAEESGAAAESPQDGQPSGPVQPKNPNGRPHLVELNAANWRPLKDSEKFALFYRDLYNWGTHLSLAIDAGLSFATNDRSFLGPGAAGYFSRYGLNVADEANFTFFNAFLFPTLFHEDPRYIPLDKGSPKARLGYALSRVIITRNDSGNFELNKSRILGTIVSTSISNVYYSSFGGETGVGSNFEDIGVNLASEAAFDVFKEFWPDVARRLKINVWVRNLVRSSIRDAIRVQ
ncbi:MAG TPA: hypothetical protein VE398_22945 [Acidobacteriota bacterium]|nr:hypothetical protein [Acidobacteriota bacterium]